MSDHHFLDYVGQIVYPHSWTNPNYIGWSTNVQQSQQFSASPPVLALADIALPASVPHKTRTFRMTPGQKTINLLHYDQSIWPSISLAPLEQFTNLKQVVVSV